jgi:thiamine transport system substrate-binding protein
MPRSILVASAAVFAALPALAQDRPVLTVYTYSSFTSEWGPGPAIETAFEEVCGCDLEFVSVDDGVAMLSRLRLEGDRTRADVVLGLDMNLVAEAKATGLLAPHELDLPPFDLPVEWTDDTFVPYDWGYFAFVYDTEALAEPPASLKELVEESDVEILIQDPRTSTPGLGLLLWMRSVYGDEAAEAWTRLRPRIVTVSNGWSESYGLFVEGEAPMVLSYTTSPAYHAIAENETRYQAAEFAEGHYLQIEVAARVAGSDEEELARSFLSFITTDAFQSVIPTTNWMYPVIRPEGGLPDAFQNLVRPERGLLFSAEEAERNRGAWIDEWLRAMSR